MEPPKRVTGQVSTGDEYDFVDLQNEPPVISRCERITNALSTAIYIPEQCIERLVGRVAAMVGERTSANERTARILLVLIGTGIVIDYAAGVTTPFTGRNNVYGENTEDLLMVLWGQCVPLVTSITAIGMSLPLSGRFTCIPGTHFNSANQRTPQLFLRINLVASSIILSILFPLLNRGQVGLSPLRAVMCMLSNMSSIFIAGSMSNLLRRNNILEPQ